MPINSFLYPGPTNSNPYVVENSCRFNDGDSAYMHKTPGGAGNRKTFTFSFWIKRSNLGAGGTLFTAGAESDTEGFFAIYFVSADNLRVTFNESSSQETTTTAVFRDPSAWLNIVVAVDTEQGTAANRVKIYVNGTQITSFSGENYPSEDYECLVSNTNAHRVGAFANSSGEVEGYFDGYMAEAVFIDGLQLTPTSFGEFNEDSPTIWKPKNLNNISGTKGTNGFYLDFKDSSNLGNDAWGGTDLTEVNLAATDSSTDSPTNNFATLNPLDKPGAGNLPGFAEGNLHYNKTATGSGNNSQASSTIAVNKGKWYFELKALDSNAIVVGIDTADNPTYDAHGNSVGGADGGTTYYNNGEKIVYGTNSSYGDTWTTNDIIGIALDLDNNKLYFSKNGTFQDSGDPTSGATGTGALSITAAASTDSGFYFFNPTDHSGSQNGDWSANFGNPPYANSSDAADGNGYGAFEYAPPSGYYALCTKNLAEYG